MEPCFVRVEWTQEGHKPCPNTKRGEMPRVTAWARLGSNQPCTRNAPVERRLVSPSFAGQTRLARLVARRVSTTLTDRSDGRRKDTPGWFAVSGMAGGLAPTFVPRVWRNHAAPGQQDGYLSGFRVEATA